MTHQKRKTLRNWLLFIIAMVVVFFLGLLFGLILGVLGNVWASLLIKILEFDDISKMWFYADAVASVLITYRY